jgi:hypothetical protein
MRLLQLCRKLVAPFLFVGLVVTCCFSLRATTMSLIIPCHYKHAPHLYPLLKAYEKQTVLPDEVVIALSECDKVDASLLGELRETPWKFPVIIITSATQKFAGENRNLACAQAQGDIFVLQDADDLPHPQRLEIIRYFFTTYDVDHLMHQFISMPTEHRRYFFLPYADMGAIPHFWPTHFAEAHLNFIPVGDHAMGGYTHGNTALRRHVFNSVQWNANRSGQDYDFNQSVYAQFKKVIVLKVPLVVYRHYLSLTTVRFSRA